MNIQTKTKYINSDMSGSPRISGNYGDLVKVLKTVLIDGFNETKSSSTSFDTQSKLLSITVNSSHGYLVNQVIQIKGSGNPLIDKEHRVKEVSTDTIKISIPDLSTNPSSQLTLKVAPLGYTLSVDKIENEGVACFTNKNEIRPSTLKVIDNRPNEFPITGAKYARVVAGYNIDSEGNFINNEKFPRDSLYPDLEVSGNGVAGAGGIHGYLKWDYVLKRTWTSGGYEVERTDVNYPIHWELIGDNRTFYLFVKPMGREYGANFLAFGDIDSIYSDTCILAGSERNYRSDTSSSATKRSGVSWNAALNQCHQYEGNFIFGTHRDNYMPELRFTTFALGGTDSLWPSTNSSISSIHGGRIFTTPVYIKDNNSVFRGQLRGVSFLYSFSTRVTTSFRDLAMFIPSKRFYHGEDRIFVSYKFSLEDWDNG